MKTLIRKHGAKIFFCVTCVLLVISLAFSAYSYARYVSHVNIDGGGTGTAPIGCNFTVDNSSVNSFINAPFMQQISENTQSVRMNTWAESIITVSNDGEVGLSYGFSFIAYLQKDFAENAMFQFLELNDPASAEDEPTVKIQPAKSASPIYKLEDLPASGTAEQLNLEETHSIIGTRKNETTGATETFETPIPNDYQSLIDEGKLLEVDTAQSYGLYLSQTREGIIDTTYATYYVDENGVHRFVCPVTASENRDNLTYYRITFNLKPTATDKFVLHEGDSRTFLFRLVLRTARPASEFNVNWDADKMWDKSADGAYIKPNDVPTAAESFSCRWAVDESGNYVFGADGKPQLQVGVGDTADKVASWQTVSLDECVGLKSPARLNMVFTQQERTQT